MRSFLAHGLQLFMALMALVLLIIPNCLAQSNAADWRGERNEAMVLDSEEKFGQALLHYQNALKLLPATAANDIAEMKTQIAMDLIRTGQYARAEAAVKEVLLLVKQLKSQHNLDANTALALRGLVEECDAGHNDAKGFTPANVKIWNSCALLGMQVCEVALPELNTPSRATATARSFLGSQNLVGALNLLEHYVSGMRPTDPELFDMQLKIACVQKLLKKPQAFEACKAKVERANSASRAAYILAGAQTWATDYRGSEHTVDEAFSRLSKTRTFSNADKVILYEARLGNALDSGQWAVAETAAKQCLQFAPPGSSRVNTYLADLSASLRMQKKNKEADLVRSKIPKTQYGFLVDEERSALKEAEQRRAGRK
ncbi:MAG: hypothetical protein JSS83_27240 [Cyanobacteria bacterium SZAS LIN-3]|nr:hypothetical protein [Cyanobacteria bacterium SZAS LIN-3]MBS2005720.1 hypothetical protein [Cyanobacteria bacterium SZAS TMP-1]